MNMKIVHGEKFETFIGDVGIKKSYFRRDWTTLMILQQERKK